MSRSFGAENAVTCRTSTVLRRRRPPSISNPRRRRVRCLSTDRRPTRSSSSRSICTSRALRWVNHADLFRINGVAGEYAELLEVSGVDTVVELAQRNTAILTAKLAEINDARHV